MPLRLSVVIANLSPPCRSTGCLQTERPCCPLRTGAAAHCEQRQGSRRTTHTTVERPFGARLRAAARSSGPPPALAADARWFNLERPRRVGAPESGAKSRPPRDNAIAMQTLKRPRRPPCRSLAESPIAASGPGAPVDRLAGSRGRRADRRARSRAADSSVMPGREAASAIAVPGSSLAAGSPGAIAPSAQPRRSPTRGTPCRYDRRFCPGEAQQCSSVSAAIRRALGFVRRQA